jgi:hypothetical protein
MRWKTAGFAVLVALSLAGAAGAVVIDKQITPETLREQPKEFTVKVEKRDDGLLHFTITRTVQGPRYYVAHLRVRHNGKTVAESHAPSFVEEPSTTFHASVVPEYVDESDFELAERFFGKSGNQKVPLPGGIDFQIRLRDFASTDAARKGDAPPAAKP